jgi:yecA family protein
MDKQSIESLEKLLKESIEDPMGIDEIHALFTAIAVGPSVVQPDKWLPLILGDDTEKMNEKRIQELIGLLLTFYNDTLRSIDEKKFVPIFRKSKDKKGIGDQNQNPSPWCISFFSAMHLHGEDWLKNKDGLLTALFPIAFFFEPEKLFNDLIHNKEKKTFSEIKEIMFDKIPDTVLELREFFGGGN